MLSDIPYAEELDPYVDGKGSFELRAQPATLRVISCIHGVRER